MFNFDKKFFEKHQSKLLYIANNRFLRWILGINRLPEQIKKQNLKIDKITTSSIHHKIGKAIKIRNRWRYTEEWKAEFFVLPRFAEALAFNLSPIANFKMPRKSIWRFSPIGLAYQLLLGYFGYKFFGFPLCWFGTTTDYYADSGDGGTYYRSGVAGSGVTWANYQPANGTNVDYTSNLYYLGLVEADTTSNMWRVLYRAHFPFDTSGLPDTATISSASFFIYGNQKFNTLSVSPTLNIYNTSGTFTTTLAASDHQLVGTTAYSTAISYASFSTTGYNEFALNATGIAAISKTGYTRFSTREANYDAANTEPTWSSGNYSGFYGYLSEETGTSRDPYISITYITTIIKTITETVSVNQASYKQTVKTFLLSLSVGGLFSKIISIYKIFSENLQIISNNFKGLAKTILENLSIIASYSKIISLLKTLTENLSVGFLKIFSLSTTFLENFLVNPVHSTILSASKILNETLKISSNIIRSIGRIFIEVLTVVDPIIIISKIFVETFSEILKISSYIYKNLAKILTQFLSITSNKFFAIGRTMVETINSVGNLISQILSKTFFEEIIVNDEGHIEIYPPENNDTYVKATSSNVPNYHPYYATDISLGSTGASAGKEWQANGVITNQRLHIDLGDQYPITHIHYENSHNSGNQTNRGVKNFTFWGSNSEADFLDLVYANDGTWEQIEIDQELSRFEQHVASNVANRIHIQCHHPSKMYRYYAFKFADNWGSTTTMGVRRIVLEMHSQDFIKIIKIFVERIVARTVLITGRILTKTEILSVASNKIISFSRNFVESILVNSQKLVSGAKTFSQSLIVAVISSPFAIGKSLIERIAGSTSWLFNKTQYTTLTDAISVGTSFIKATGRIFISSINILSNYTFLAARVFVESINVAVDFIISRYYLFVEAISVAGELGSFVVGKVIEEIVKIAIIFREGRNWIGTEVINVSSSIYNQITRIFNEILSVGTSLTRAIGRIFTQSVKFGDIVAFGKQLFTELSDSLSAASNAILSTARTFSEVIVAAGEIGNWVIAKLLVDPIKVAYEYLSAWTLARIFSETISAISNLSNQAGKILSESIAITGEFVLGTISKVIVEIVKITDTVAKYLPKVFSETLSASSEAFNQAGKIFVENVSMVGQFVLGTISKLLSEAVSIASDFSKTWTLSRVYSEVLNVAGAVYNQAGKIFSETINIVGEFVLGTISKVLSETIKIYEMVEKSLPAQIFSEIIAVSSSAFNGAIKIFSEAITSAGEMAGFAINKLLQESINVISTTYNLTSRILSETINALDATVKYLSGRIFTETPGVNNPTSTKLTGRTFTENLSINWGKIKLVLNGIQVGLWKKVARVSSGVWKKISRNGGE